MNQPKEEAKQEEDSEMKDESQPTEEVVPLKTPSTKEAQVKITVGDVVETPVEQPSGGENNALTRPADEETYNKYMGCEGPKKRIDFS